MITNIIFDWQGVLKNVKLNTEIFEWIKKKSREGYDFSILSNYSGNISKTLELNQYDSYFQEIITPRNYPVQKPSKEAFNLLMKKINSKPEECLFIDDYLINIKAAQNLGFKTIHYKDNQTFFKKIKENNL